MIARRDVTLDSIKVDTTACIREIAGSPAVRQRLSEMGLTVGSRVRVVRVAPLGDPLQISVRHYHLSLRRREGQCVLVDPL